MSDDEREPWGPEAMRALLRSLEARGVELSDEEHRMARRIEAHLENEAHLKRLLSEGIGRYAPGMDARRALPEILGPMPRRGPDRDARAERVALHYCALTGQLEEWVLEAVRDELPALPAEPLFLGPALEAIRAEWGFKTDGAAWQCLRRYRASRRRAIKRGGPRSPLHPDAFTVPKNPND